MITPIIPVQNNRLINETTSPPYEIQTERRWFSSNLNCVFVLLSFMAIILIAILILSIVFVVKMSKVESQTRSSMRVMHKSISKAVQDISNSQIAQARMLSAQSMLPSMSMHPSAANMLQKSSNVIPIQAQSFGPSDTNTTSTEERSKDLKNYENCTSTC